MVTNNLPGVQWTLLIPLLARARMTRKYKTLINDPQAIEIVERLSGSLPPEDPSQLIYHDLCMAARARTLDDAVKAFTTDHPKATIVNLGAGFDCGFSRTDNGEISWYDVDLPEVIAIRKLLIAQTDRSHCVAGSILDNNWMQEVVKKDTGLFIIAGGLLPYFEEREVKSLISAIADNFTECNFLFDVVSCRGLVNSNQHIKNSGFSSAPMKWVVNQKNDLSTWDKRVTIQSHFPLFSRIERTSDFDQQTIQFMDKSDRKRHVCFVRLSFHTANSRE